QPALLYWNGATVNAMHALRALRKDGVPVYFTIDAGPQIKALCPPEFAATTAATLAAVPGVQSVLRTGLGPGAHLLSGAAPFPHPARGFCSANTPCWKAPPRC